MIKRYIDPNTPRDALDELPDEVKGGNDAHTQLYRTDPEAAHYWDPIVVGVPGGPVATLLLTYTGRKSGKSLSTALQYYRFEGKVAVVGSRGGTIDHPMWYLNLLADPNCHVQIVRDGFDAVARTATGDERRRWWQHVVETQPIQAEYQGRTSREIPVVILDPRDGTKT